MTVEVEPIDPCATAFASRRADDRWFCWEEPDRDGFAIGAHRQRPRGRLPRDGSRSTTCAATRPRSSADRLADEPGDLPPRRGAALGRRHGLRADDSAGSGPWSSLPPALLAMPELLLARIGGRHHLTLCARRRRGDDPGALSVAPRGSARRAARRGAAAARPRPRRRCPGGLGAASCALRGRGRGGRRAGSEPVTSTSSCSPVRCGSPPRSAHSPAAALRRAARGLRLLLRFCVGTPEAAFLGASPELLVRRTGGTAATVALAGSARRSADPAVDDHLGEQLLHSAKDRDEHAIVARRIGRRLAPLSVWVEAAPEPVVIKVANIQHLATPIHAQLAESRSALELAALLHPTPAVGPEPRGERGEAMIAELEGMDRGWYAGPVGWMDAAEDGEFCVALRSALLRDRTAHLYAGAGIVAGSDPGGGAGRDRDQAGGPAAAAGAADAFPSSREGQWRPRLRTTRSAMDDPRGAAPDILARTSDSGTSTRRRRVSGPASRFRRARPERHRRGRRVGRRVLEEVESRHALEVERRAAS